jgi:hypothetical protein
MRSLICALVLAGSAAMADDTLDGAEIAALLTGHKVVYADGATQLFQADGGTVYDNGKPSTGRWTVQGDRYCSVWPPSDRWGCYDVTQGARGVGFVADDGSVTLGQIAS